MHLWLPHPSPTLWKELQGFRADRRAADTTTTAARHPLLRSLGRDVRELQLRLPTHVDQHHLDGDRPATLLGTLQRDLRDDRLSTGVAVDDTLQVHACHGPTRQVEVLREVLLRLFEDDPTLEPRDVLVMCPDVETFAPLISSVFGLGPGLPHPGNRLRVRLADRSLRQTNPLLDTVAALLDLAGGRVTASQVLDLAAAPAVRRHVRLRRRGPRAPARLGRPGGRPVGPGRRRPAAVRAGGVPAEHLGGRPRPDPARRHHRRDRARLARAGAAPGRRRQRRHRPGRPVRRTGRPARHRAAGPDR